MASHAMMKTLSLFLGFVLMAGVTSLSGQAQSVDTSKIGPQVGTVVPAFSGTDQFGRTQSLAAAMGPKGAMLVFFRSADW